MLLYLHSSFAVLYNKVNYFELALSNSRKAIEIDLRLEKINNLANIYNSLGELYFNSKGDFDSAMYFFYSKSVECALPTKRKIFNWLPS